MRTGIGLRVTDAAVLRPGAGYTPPAPLRFSGTPAASPLSISTYDGSGETVHPSVVYFASPWNGHRWWMAITPFPNNSVLENPCIYYSDDGVSWSDSGISNPIDPQPFPGHSADTELLYNASDDKLYCYWTERVVGTSYRVKVKSSSNGISWSAESTCIDLNESIAGAASPTVILDGSTYKMWVNDYVATPNVFRLYTSSTPDGTFTYSQDCTIYEIPHVNIGREIWHQGIEKIGSYYYALLNFSQANVSGGNTTLNFAVSQDGINWYVQDGFFHDFNQVAWSRNPYRGVLVYEGSTLWCYYSGYDISDTYGFARSQLTSTNWNNALPVAGSYATLANSSAFRLRGHNSDRVWNRANVQSAWNGTPAYTTFPLTGLSCFSFGGSNNVATNYNPSAAGSYSFSCWFRKTQNPDGSRNSIVWGRNLAGSFSFDHSNAAFREALIFNNGAWVNSLKLTPILNEFVHYVAVFDNTENTVTLYRNGASVGSVTKGTISSDAPYGAGRLTTVGGFVFGDVAECMHFDFALSPSEVATLYAAE